MSLFKVTPKKRKSRRKEEEEEEEEEGIPEEKSRAARRNGHFASPSSSLFSIKVPTPVAIKNW